MEGLGCSVLEYFMSMGGGPHREQKSIDCINGNGI